MNKDVRALTVVNRLEDNALQQSKACFTLKKALKIPRKDLIVERTSTNGRAWLHGWTSSLLLQLFLYSYLQCTSYVLPMYYLYKDIPGIFHEQMVLLLPKSKLSMKAVETFCSPPNKPIDWLEKTEYRDQKTTLYNLNIYC